MLFPRDGVYAQPFDASTAQLSGQPVRIVTDSIDPTTLSVSTTGVIVYARPTPTATQLVWVNRTGDRLSTIGPVMQAQDPQISLDGKHLAVTLKADGSRIWLIETARGVPSRWTTKDHANNNPVFSPDGKSIVYNSVEGSVFDLYEGPTAGMGQHRLLLKSKFNKIPSDWSEDGRYILYSERTDKGNRNLWGLPLAKASEPIRLSENEFDEWQAQFSPDGKWIALVSNRSGENEVYVQRFPKGTAQHRISANGGTQPRWGHDGAELFYIASDQQLMSVEVRLPPRNLDSDLEVGKSAPLFQVRAVPSVYDQNQQQYDVTAHSQRFLLNAPVEQSGKPITVILNWTVALKRAQR
jgi:eukaryotic-like serine/threonine-protein kinase